MTQATQEQVRTGVAGTATPGAGTPRRGVRADIQGLRALAVSSVVVFHFWPSLLPGGFTGVDVFFVVSGFLITGRILRDVEFRTPVAFVAHFWAARVRRILPAALLVAGIVLVASWLVLPESGWSVLGGHVFASALSVENWHLAKEAVDYGAEGAAPSPMQHYWSLSVEEQFYLFWPLLLLGTVLVARLLQKRTVPTRVPRRLVLGVVMATVAISSFVYALAITASDPAAAYFVTPARVWQLAAGGLIALLAVRLAGRWGRAVPWVGLGLIALGFALLSTGTAYPGWAALLPTVGTCLVLLGGPAGRWSFDVLSRPRPVQWLGDVSYSVYLWHWPLIILAPAVLDHRLGNGDKFWLLVVTLGLAQLSYRFVEQPARRGRLLRRPRRSWAIGALAIAVVATSAMRFADAGEDRVEEATEAFAARETSGDPCFAGHAVENHCSDKFAPIDKAAAIAGSSDKPLASSSPQCSDTTGPFTKVVCHLGDPTGDRTVLVWGNSHASAWSDAFDKVGKLLGMNVIVAARSSCSASLSQPSKSASRVASPDEKQGCRERTDWVLDSLVPKADIVVMADLRSGYQESGWPVDGYVDAIQRIRDTGAEVVWLADVPLTATLTTRRDGPQCLEQRGQCTNSVDRALAAAPVTAEVVARVADLPVIQTRDRFCDAEQCYAAIGGVSVYFDTSHLTGTFSRSLGPWLARELRGCLTDPRSCS